MAHQSDSALNNFLATVNAAPAGPETGAYFDLDGTLLHGHSALAFFANRLRHGEWPAEAWHTLTTSSPHRLIRGLFQALAGTEAPLAAGISAAASAYWHGRPEAELNALSERVFREETAPLLSRAVWSLVRAHQARGHTVAIATSASNAQARPIATALGINHLVCTDVPVAHGLIRADPAPALCIATRKLEQVRKHAQRERIRLPESFAYCDGNDDIPLLAGVGHPRAVNPRNTLASEAFRRGWPTARFGPGNTPLLSPAWSTAGAGLASVAAAGLMTVLTDDAADPDGPQAASAAVALGCDALLRAAGVKVRVTGEEHLWSHRPAVFVINHTSPIDAVVVGQLLRERWFPLVKSELAGTPFISTFLTATGAVLVDRNSPAQSATVLTTAFRRLRCGLSLVAAPEGTRARTPDLGPFLPGAFAAARAAGVPVIPVAIHNATDALPRDGRFLRPGTIRVTVLAPVDTSGWRKADITEHTECVRGLFLKALHC
ncbi:MAG: HAD-IB family hydrolase [Streptomyces sp.]